MKFTAPFKRYFVPPAAIDKVANSESFSWIAAIWDSLH